MVNSIFDDNVAGQFDIDEVVHTESDLLNFYG
jgi:hypothetical protein